MANFFAALNRRHIYLGGAAIAVVASVFIMQGEAGAPQVTEVKDCPECPVLVMVPPGRFNMGTSESEEGHEKDESPLHEVTIPRALAVGKFEVTFAEWDACVADGACGGYRPSDDGWGRGTRPVIHVSFNDTQSYLTWLSGKTGRQYRLLSESEWEYAARAGTATPYFWGARVSRDQANYGSDACCMGFAQGADRWENTAPAGSFPPNGFGLHDMSGNVWEWTLDCRNERYDGAPSDGSAWTSGNCSVRVMRGGSWFSDPGFVRSAIRDYDSVGDRNYDGGFRVARVF